MRIHLVTYATPRFRLRQLVLGWSARVNHVADTVTHWTPEMLRDAGFEKRCKDIKLSERGSGFWAWKPFIIDAKLREVADGDLVFYCDVGRLYPFKLLDQPVTPYVRWMDDHGQDVMPGVYIPWDGATSVWTKREALVATGMDRPQIHTASPVQASFSIWRASARSREFATQWLDLCSQRTLISDDPSRDGLTELQDFRGHRHDQALLSLCCFAKNVAALSLGNARPGINAKHPSEVSRLIFGDVPGTPSPIGRVLRRVARPIGHIEQRLRQKVKLGQPINE
ncbi:MAG: hypothetical protein B9S30_06545 [Verrucomicrobiia bacterium Tous-C5FEB]|nr:MAG: hypothetical protein B9S30_06545 [Verrucomicrobiae bacterium Tous-C5FEB]